MLQTPLHSAGTYEDERNRPLVLVVDGGIMSQFATSMVLQRLDYHAFPVKSAEDALEIASFVVPAVIVTEINLSKMSGIDLLSRIKQDSRTRDVPVLIYTTQKDPGYRQRCGNAGCAGYLTQPAEPGELYAALQKATERVPRNFVRLTTSLDVIVGAEGIPCHEMTKAKVTALSENGMFVSTIMPLPYGTVFPFTLFLKNPALHEIRFEGKVLYSHAVEKGSAKQQGMGVKFTQIRQEDREAIRIFIKEKLMEGIAVPIKS